MIELVLHLAFGGLLGWIIHDLVLSYRRLHARGDTPCFTCHQTPTISIPTGQESVAGSNPWLAPLTPANPWLAPPNYQELNR